MSRLYAKSLLLKCGIYADSKYNDAACSSSTSSQEIGRGVA